MFGTAGIPINFENIPLMVLVYMTAIILFHYACELIRKFKL